MASEKTLNDLFEMLIERLQCVESKLSEVQEKKSNIFKNMCHCQILNLEMSKDHFKLTTRNPVLNCAACGWVGYIKKNDT